MAAMAYVIRDWSKTNRFLYFSVVFCAWKLSSIVAGRVQYTLVGDSAAIFAVNLPWRDVFCTRIKQTSSVPTVIPTIVQNRAIGRVDRSLSDWVSSEHIPSGLAPISFVPRSRQHAGDCAAQRWNHLGWVVCG